MSQQQQQRQGIPLPLSLAQPQHSYFSSINEPSNIPPPPSYRASVHEKHRLDFPGRIERKLAQYNSSQNVYKRWLFEIVSVATSAVCMGKTPSVLPDLYMC